MRTTHRPVLALLLLAAGLAGARTARTQPYGYAPLPPPRFEPPPPPPPPGPHLAWQAGGWD